MSINIKGIFDSTIGKAVSAIILPVLKDVAGDLIKIGPDEISALIAKVSFEAATKDGFTKEERYAYAKERLLAIKGKEIGNKYTDKFFDFLIQGAVDRWLKDANGGPIVPPKSEPKKDIYYQPLDEKPDFSLLVSGDKVWYRASDAKWFVTGRVGAGNPEKMGFAFFALIP